MDLKTSSTVGYERRHAAPRAVSPFELASLAEAGAQVVDVRSDRQFDDAHVPGAICLPMLHAGFGTKLAWVVDLRADVLLVGRDEDGARRAARLAEAVGVTRVTGVLAGGMTVWREEGRPVGRVERLDVADLPARRADDPALQVLDVRERSEWDAGHLEGSLLAPYHDLHSAPPGLDLERPVAVVCASGQRAAVAASLVVRLGATSVIHVTGGGVPSLL